MQLIQFQSTIAFVDKKSSFIRSKSKFAYHMFETLEISSNSSSFSRRQNVRTSTRDRINRFISVYLNHKNSLILNFIFSSTIKHRKYVQSISQRFTRSQIFRHESTQRYQSNHREFFNRRSFYDDARRMYERFRRSKISHAVRSFFKIDEKVVLLRSKIQKLKRESSRHPNQFEYSNRFEYHN